MAIPLKYNLRNLARRKSRTLLTVVGMALTVFVAVLTLGLVRCMWGAVANNASPDNIVLLSRKGQNAIQSQIEETDPALLESLPPLKRTAKGIGLVSPELVYMFGVSFDEHPKHKQAQAHVRGVDPEVAFLVNDRVRVRREDADRGVAGPALDGGILVGRNVHIALGVPREWIGVGKVLWYGPRPDDPAAMPGNKLVILGYLDAPGTVYDTEIWFHLDHLKALTDVRKISQITLKVRSPADLPDALASIRGREDVKLDAMAETEYYADYYDGLRASTLLVMLIALVVCAGGILVGMNTMYAAVMGRVREIGTLRVLGFSSAQVLASFLLESVLLSGTAGAIGAAAGFLFPVAFQGFRDLAMFNTMFVFRVAPEVLAAGFALSLLMGVVGAFPPALKGVRLQVVDAIRAV
ncbi:MAG: ABC transporter permease [Planctomycetes bacterium]|jgi:ABC-type lipoprotein release transport system permease subunit|nr:ABC transporter permease [Planctomycetota bacterium]